MPATAYAENGQFASLASTAGRGLARAAQENQPALADDISIRIKLYEAEQRVATGMSPRPVLEPRSV